jgi:hypothetical protein
MRQDEILVFSKDEYRPMSVRITCSLLKENFDQAYSVSAKGQNITVKRIS